MAIIDDRDYGLGYDAGYQDGRRQGYTEGFEDAAREYEARIGKLHAEIRTMEARMAVLTRRVDNGQR